MVPKFDFHVHTRYSDGTSEPLAMVEAAEARGMEAVALTDHGPELHVGIFREKLDTMFQDVKSARDEASIPVLAGIEANVMDGNGRVDVDEELAMKLDLLVVGIHTLGNIIEPVEVAREYLRRVTRALETRDIDVLGHPFYYYQNLLPYLPPEDIEDFVRLVADRGVAMEVNSKYRAPDDDFLAICLREGVKFSIGSDAHRPIEVGRIDWSLSTLRRVGAKREDLILDDLLG